MAQHNQEIIKVCIPVSTEIPIVKSPIKEDITQNTISYIYNQIELLKEEINKTNNNLNHRNARERDDSDILYERIALLEKENECLKNEIKNHQLIIQMITSNEQNEQRMTQYKSSNYKNPNFSYNKPSIPTPINLTNRFECLLETEKSIENENENKSEEITPTIKIPNDKPKSRKGHQYITIRNKLIQPDVPNNDNNNRRPSVVVNNHPENDRLNEKIKRVVPGPSSYVDIVNNGKKVKIFGTSMIKGIRSKEFNSFLKGCQAEFKSYPGATIKELKHNIQFPLEIETPDTVLIHGGCNDISPRKNQEKLTEEEIANQIISIGLYCQDKGVNEIVISGLICRKGQYYNSRVSKVNTCLQKLCLQKGFYFIDNSKIKENNLYKDGLHLLESGKIILARNFTYYLNCIYNVNINGNL